MLLLSRNRRLRILEQPIRTIYLDGNASSHFNPLLDSMRIYFVLLRFAMISMFTAVMDNLLFSAVLRLHGQQGHQPDRGPPRRDDVQLRHGQAHGLQFARQGDARIRAIYGAGRRLRNHLLRHDRAVHLALRDGRIEIQTACRRHSLPGQFPRAARHHLHRRQGSRVAGSPCRQKPPPRPPPTCRDERHSAAP